MAEMDDNQSISSAYHRLDAHKLSYNEMTVDPSGSIMSREVKMEWRQKLGYCVTCTERPVLLYTLKRSRLNPLWQSKHARSVAGECENGICLRCQKEKQAQEQQQQQQQQRRTNLNNHSNATPAMFGSSTMSGHQSSSSTLGSMTDYITARSNGSSESLRYPQTPVRTERSSFVRHSQHQHHHYPSLPVRTYSNEESIMLLSHHSNSLLNNVHSTPYGGGGTHHHHNGPDRLLAGSHNSPNRGLSRTEHHQQQPQLRAALLPRSSTEHDVPMMPSTPTPYHHHHPRAVGAKNGNDGEDEDEDWPASPHPSALQLPVPTLISPHKRPSSSRQFSCSNFSVASSLSNDFSVPSLEEESMMAVDASTGKTTTTTSGGGGGGAIEDRNTANPTTIHAALQLSEEDKIMDQLRILLRDLQTNPKMAAEVLLYALKSNEEHANVLLFCVESIQVPGEIVTSSVRTPNQSKGMLMCGNVQKGFVHLTFLFVFVNLKYGQGIYRGVLQAMKNHRHCIPLQQASLTLLVEWSEEDDLRPLLIRHGLCDQLSPLLTLHVGDVAIVRNVVALLRLVTLEEEGRVLCQRMNMSQLVVHGMECHANHTQIQTDACAVLSNLAVDVKQKSVAIVSPAILDAVTAALLKQVNVIAATGNSGGRGNNGMDWTVIKSACFTLKNFLYRQENLRALASRDELLQGLETLIQLGPRRSKDAVAVLEKLQLSRVQDESLQTQVLETLQRLWYRPVPEALDDILAVWKEHTWSTRILVVSLHQIQDMLQSNEYTDPSQIDRIVEATKDLEDHSDERVTREVQLLQALLAGE